MFVGACEEGAGRRPCASEIGSGWRVGSCSRIARGVVLLMMTRVMAGDESDSAKLRVAAAAALQVRAKSAFQAWFFGGTLLQRCAVVQVRN
jgi:hypothetical protein